MPRKVECRVQRHYVGELTIARPDCNYPTSPASTSYWRRSGAFDAAYEIKLVARPLHKKSRHGSAPPATAGNSGCNRRSNKSGAVGTSVLWRTTEYDEV
eukprot:scaffold51111_cov37-Tisochrysis_lutea.AAC.2